MKFKSILNVRSGVGASAPGRPSLTAMESWFGGGILFAVAAVLWLAYLVPNWLQRREYIASERNAVRLQQTIRVLAETAEAPDAVRMESAAKARVVASKMAKQRVLAEARATVDVQAAAAARLRRTRLATTSLLAIALGVLGWQGWLAVTVGVEAVSTMTVAIAGLLALGGGALLRGVNRTASARAAKAAAEARRAADASTQPVVPQRRVVSRTIEQPTREWTPQRLPQPLSQLRREAMIAAARAEALGKSARAAEEDARIAAADEHRRADVRERELLAAAGAAPSRYASMGLVDHDAAPASIDLDSAIARRRAS